VTIFGGPCSLGEKTADEKHLDRPAPKACRDILSGNTVLGSSPHKRYDFLIVGDTSQSRIRLDFCNTCMVKECASTALGPSIKTLARQGVGTGDRPAASKTRFSGPASPKTTLCPDFLCPAKAHQIGHSDRNCKETFAASSTRGH